MADVMSESNELLGDAETPVDFESYEPKSSKAAGKLLEDWEDTEAEFKKEVASITVPQPIVVSETSLQFPDYSYLANRIKSKDDIYEVKNTADIPLVIDWDLNLIPHDVRPDFDKYLAEKYVQYGLQHLIGKVVMIALMVEGTKTVNFLFQFMDSRQYPTIIAIQSGKEFILRSQFVIPSGESVICTEKQLESLKRYQKIRREYQHETNSTQTDWLGFLVFKPLNEEGLRFVKRSYVTKADLLKSNRPVSMERAAKKLGVGQSNVVIATE